MTLVRFQKAEIWRAHFRGPIRAQCPPTPAPAQREFPLETKILDLLVTPKFIIRFSKSKF